MLSLRPAVKLCFVSPTLQIRWGALRVTLKRVKLMAVKTPWI